MVSGVATLAAPKGTASEAADVPAPIWQGLTIRQRLAKIREDSFGIDKEEIAFGTVKFDAHKAEAVLAAIRPMLARYNLDLEPNLIERTYTGNRCDVLIDWEFVCLDDETQARKIRWAGAGTDNSDKGYAKATTNSLKEMLKKRFLVTDRDDAKEEEEKVEHQTDDGVSRKALEKEREHNKKLYEEKANLVRGLFKSAETLADVERLEREHKAWINKTPEAMRVFFTDAIAKRKAHFKAKAPETPPTKEEMEAADLLLAEREGGPELWEDEK
jgi:hypothetical protein